MTDDEVEIIREFCSRLTKAAQQQSEADIFKHLARTDQWLADLRRTYFGTQITARTRVERLIHSNKELEKALDVGFGPFLSNVGGVITTWEHVVDEHLAKAEENDNPYNIQDLDTDLPGQYEVYEPNPYDGTYSEE